MSYPKVNRNGEIYSKHTLKEKHAYYAKKANSPNSINSQGEKIDFVGRVALANEALRLRKQMGQNKRNYDYYNGQR